MEKQGYRENIALLTEIFPGRAAISVKEAADVTGTSKDAVYDMIKRVHNPLPHQKMGARVLIPVAGLARWMCG